MELNFLGNAQIEFLREGLYILPNETPQSRFKEIVDKVREYELMYSEGLGNRIEYMIDKNILSLSTPVISNFGRKKDLNRTTQDLPASCYIITVDDSISEIYHSIAQVAVASKLGGGVGSDFQMVSQKGTKLNEGFYSNSKLDWIEDSVGAGQKVSQGAKRRGYNTPFISIEDNDFDCLMERIDKSNPNKTDRLINNTVGIILQEGFRQKIQYDKEAQRRYLKVLEARKKTGKVYMLDVENANKNCSPVYKKLGLKVATTNICTEFLQPLFPDLTSVCVISALNAVHWDEIKKNPQMIKDAFTFLDIVNEEYIKLSEGIPFLEKAHESAKQKRDIGLGLLGFAELLQMKSFAYGDIGSRIINKEIFSTIRKYGEETTYELGLKLGSPEYCKRAGMIRRNASLMMVAPNKSTSFISDATSGGFEPFMSNMFLKSLAKIQFIFKNKHLAKLLVSKGQDNSLVWDTILANNGSAQHLDFLDDHEKAVFKTFTEVSPKDIIDLAADRQEFIDMGQSLNLVFRKNYTMKDIYDIHKYAWEKGIKTLYYAYNSAHAALEQDGDKWDSCVSCAD
jgi:ribonucleoside-diphosphate reductase alpha chain